MGKCEICSREIVSLHEHKFPEDIRNEGKYCVCIPWETMGRCIELSLDNAQRLVEDAEYLRKGGKLSSAAVLTIFSLEESGKALLACEYLTDRKKVSMKNYQEMFLNHKPKLDEALKALEKSDTHRAQLRKALWRNVTKELHKERLNAIFVNYNGQAQIWQVPWSQNPKPLVVEAYGLPFINLKTAKKYRQAQEPIKDLFIKMLIQDAKMAIHLAQQRHEQLKNKGVVS